MRHDFIGSQTTRYGSGTSRDKVRNSPWMLVISFVAGKQIQGIADLIGTKANPVIRVMPNTPTLVGAGMAAISCCALVTAEQRQFVLGFLGAVGKVIEVR
jgi:pyrroline-5-carboxylate reductase